MRRLQPFVIYLGVVLAAAFLIRAGHRLLFAQIASAAVNVQPVVLYQELIDYQRDANGLVEQRYEVDLRPDGTLVEGNTIMGFLNRPDLMVRTARYLDGRVETLVPHTRLRVPMPANSHVALARRAAIEGNGTCVTKILKLIGKEKILDWEAEVLVYDQMDSSGKLALRRTFWRVPKLGCAIVQARFEGGDTRLRSEVRTVRVERTVRSGVIVGDDFRVVRPSEGYRSITDAVGRTPDTEREKLLDEQVSH